MAEQTFSEYKIKLQEFFKDGLVTIIGSGLSIAEGIPGMNAIQRYLEIEIPKQTSLKESWEPVNKLLISGHDIESALIESPPSAQLESQIVVLAAKFLLNQEQKVIEEVINGRTLRFARLLKHMLKPNNGIPVITTNYDRLLEIATECAGLGVDTMFCGHHVCSFDPKGSRYSFCRGAHLSGGGTKTVTREYVNFIKLYKPHGSLDWYLKDNNPIRCPYNLNLQRLIITPGLNKYINGYDRPFDKHRDKANEEIDRASRFLIIGYGFNDSHLETHLSAELKKGKHALIITHALTPKAKGLLDNCDNICAVIANEQKAGARIITKNQKDIIVNENLWDINVFIDEVLEP